MDKQNQINLYRQAQKRKCDLLRKEQDFFNKYKDFIELDTVKRAVARIVRAVRKYLLHKPINVSDLDHIPGLLRFRAAITELNIFTADIQDEIVKGLCFDTSNKDRTEKSEIKINQKNVLYWVVIDLRAYGLVPFAEIKIKENGQTVYLSNKQMKTVETIWNKINPDTNVGVQYQQMLDCSKVLVKYYVESGFVV